MPPMYLSLPTTFTALCSTWVLWPLSGWVCKNGEYVQGCVRASDLTCRVDSSGAIVPPNAQATPVTFGYTPAVSLSFSERLESGDATGLVNLTVTATFATPVSGVTAEDFNITGALPRGYHVVSDTQFSMDFEIYNATEHVRHEVWVRLAAASGTITPPNFKAPDVVLEYSTSFVFTHALQDFVA